MVKGIQPDLYVHWDLLFLRDDSVTERVGEADNAGIRVVGRSTGSVGRATPN